MRITQYDCGTMFALNTYMKNKYSSTSEVNHDQEKRVISMQQMAESMLAESKKYDDKTVRDFYETIATDLFNLAAVQLTDVSQAIKK